MNPVLPDEAIELAGAAAKAFDALGGVDAFRRAEDDPAVRAAEVAPALAALGIDDLDPRQGDVALAAAAALCEAAGRGALPYPLAAALVRDRDGRPTAATPAAVARIDHGDLFAEWRVGPLGGAGPAGIASGAGGLLGSKLGPFACDLSVAPGPVDAADVLLQQLLVAWTVLGTVDRAVELAVEHVNGRIQFGKPLAAFQAVQFQLADAAVAVAGLRELAGFTLWRWDGARAAARADVLALRLPAGEVARAVLRAAQQLHGAAGVCDEYDVSVLARAAQPLLRLPFGAERAAAELAAAIADDGFAGLFPHGAELRSEASA
ncbi:MAG: acyl-CoA dehydrogenase family protein [Acidimicrobiales bacterium]